MKLSIRHLYIFIFCTLLIPTTTAQEDSLYFQVLNMKDGLPGSTVLDLEQAKLGFVWIATNEGLCRYDGQNFRIYRHDPTNDNSLWDNYIQKLYLDQNENLWIMTTNGLNLMDLKTQTMQRISPDPVQGGLIDNSPIDMVETREGVQFIASYYSGISFKPSSSSRYQYLDASKTDGSALSSNNINCLSLFADSLLFIGYRDAGVDIYNTKNHTTVSLESITDQPLRSKNIKAICQNENEGLWIGTDAGIAYYAIKESRLYNYPFNKEENQFVTDREILSIAKDQRDFLWIGTRRSGLVIVKQTDVFKFGEKATFQQYLPTQQSGSLSYRTVLSIFEDRNKTFWIGTHGGGVNIGKTSLNRFGLASNLSSGDKKISYNKVWGLAEDKYGNIWVGTDGDGINTWNPKDGIINHYKYNPESTGSLSDNAVISALKDSKDQMWIGTYEGGVNRFDEKTASFIHYKGPFKIPANDIRCIYEDKQQRLWVGMNRKGIALYDNETDKFVQMPNTEDYDVRAIYEENDVLWLGTYSAGLLKYTINDSTAELIDGFVSGAENVSIQTIYSIYGDGQGMLWIGTDNLGICQYNIHTNESKMFSESNGLPNNKVHGILPDNNGNLWLSTNSGISRFHINTNRFYNFDWNFGVQPLEFHNGSQHIGSDGTYYFGGIGGLNYFNPDKFKTNVENLNLQFTDFSVMNKRIIPEEDNIIRAGIEYQPDIALKFDQNFFTIEFQSLNYPKIGNLNYEYKLEGYDNKWIDAKGSHAATYKNIPPGDYVFLIRCFDQNLSTVIDQKQLQLSISPPWWKTGLAYGIYLLFIGLIAVIIFRYRVKQFHYKSQINYEKKLREKQQKLHSERMDFFTNISHELRTPLTIIGVALDELNPLNNNQKLKRTYDTAVKNTNHLMDLISKLLEFRRVETGVTSLAVEKIHLNLFLPTFLQDYVHLAKHQKIDLKLSLPVEEMFLWLDQDKFSMILSNLLSNALKNTPAGGEIILNIGSLDRQTYIDVIDTGIGIEKKNLKKIFNRYYKLENKSTNTGIGLALTKSLVELHQGEIMVKSTIRKGSSFRIIFKNGMSHFSQDQMLISTVSEKPFQVGSEWLGDDAVMLSNNHQIILLIDDNQEILDLLYDKFSDHYKVIRANSGEEGVQLAKKYGPDLIISDVMMPGISGIEVCQQLKNEALTSHIPIILLTAKGSAKDEIEGLNTGADQYISKPFKLPILKAQVNSILKNRQHLIDYFEKKTDTNLNNQIKKEPKELLFLNMLRDYILKNCLEKNVSVFDIAADLGYSRTSLYRKVKSLTGMSINAFVRSVRINKSAALISEGMNVSEAAYSVGFENLKYFRECFKKQIGQTPSALK